MNFLLWIIIAILSLFVLYNLMMDIKKLMQKKMHEGMTNSSKPYISRIDINNISDSNKCHDELKKKSRIDGNKWNAFSYNDETKKCTLYEEHQGVKDLTKQYNNSFDINNVADFNKCKDELTQKGKNDVGNWNAFSYNQQTKKCTLYEGHINKPNYYDKKADMSILFSKELKQNKKPKIAGTNIKEVIKTEVDSKEKCEFELENQRDASGNDGLWNVFAYNVTAKQCILYDGEINKDSEFNDSIETEQECSNWAKRNGYAEGGGGFAFSGNYNTNGCYYYDSGEWKGKAFWSIKKGKCTPSSDTKCAINNYNTYDLPPRTQLNVFELENQKNGSCPVGCAKPVCISGDCNEIIVRNNKKYKKCPYKCVGGNQRRTDVSLEDAGGCRYNSECKDVCDHKLFLGNETNAGKWDWQQLSCGDTDANSQISNNSIVYDNGSSTSGSSTSGLTQNDQESRQRYSRGQYCDSFCSTGSKLMTVKGTCDKDNIYTKNDCSNNGGLWTPNEDGGWKTINVKTETSECTEGCKIRDCPNCGGPPLTDADYAADDSVDMINPMTGENRLGGSKTEFDRRMKNNKAQSKFYYDSVWKLFG